MVKELIAMKKLLTNDSQLTHHFFREVLFQWRRTVWSYATMCSQCLTRTLGTLTFPKGREMPRYSGWVRREKGMRGINMSSGDRTPQTFWALHLSSLVFLLQEKYLNFSCKRNTREIQVFLLQEKYLYFSKYCYTQYVYNLRFTNIDHLTQRSMEVFE